MKEFFQNIFSNAWVVGIVGGIISGIIVYFITRWLFERKDKSKHLENINNANLDIIRLLKPYVAERGLPEKEIIDAIILSTARKYGVKSEELYSIRIICEEIIREIIENVYVSSEKKQEYTNNLKEYLHELNVERDKSLLITDLEKEIKNSMLSSKENYRKDFLSTLSMLLSILAATLTMTFSLLVEDSLFVGNLSHEAEQILIVLFTATISICLPFLLLISQKMKSKTKDKSKNRDSKE